MTIAVVAGLSELSLYSHRSLTYLVFPGLIWAALRFAQRGATLAIAIVAGFAVLATTHFVGPFASHSLARSVLMTQLYIAVAALATLCLGAAVPSGKSLPSDSERRARDRSRRPIPSGGDWSTTFTMGLSSAYRTSCSAQRRLGTRARRTRPDRGSD